MARKFSVVLLLALAVVFSSAQSGTVTAQARGGFEFSGNDGKATGTIVGEIKLGTKPSADLMIVVKDTGGATKDGLEEAIIFLKSVEKSTSKGNLTMVTGKGTFQGNARTIEIQILDGKRAGEKDSVRIRVLQGKFVDFDKSVTMDGKAITVGK